jgi:hypothetical protein
LSSCCQPDKDHLYGKHLSFIPGPLRCIFVKTFDMQTIHPTYRPEYYPATQKISLVKKFISWCKSQEEKRLGWLAVMLFLHGCVLAPVTIAFIFLGGNQMVFWAFVIAAMAMTLVSNLAAMPTKITIPIFFLSLLIDLTVIVMNIVLYIQS